jgi:hypothetical protein
MRRKRWTTGAMWLLLLVLIAEVGLSTRRESASWDEGDHIYSGYMNWKHGEYSLNPEHPPLVKLVATLPLLPLDLKIAPRQGRYFKSEAYYGGRELLFRNDPKYGGHYSADTLLFRIHMTVLVFAATLAVLLFLAGSEMFGGVAGLIAMALFVFDPTVLTNAPFVTTDIGAAFGFFASVYTFYRFVKVTIWQRALLCGLAVGLALAAKHSAVLLLPILLLLGAGDIAGRWKTERMWPRRHATRLLTGMAAIAACAIFLLWSIYSFRFAMHPVGVEMPHSQARWGRSPPPCAPPSPSARIFICCRKATSTASSTCNGSASICRRTSSADSTRTGNGSTFLPSCRSSGASASSDCWRSLSMRSRQAKYIAHARSSFSPSLRSSISLWRWPGRSISACAMCFPSSLSLLPWPVAAQHG